MSQPPATRADPVLVDASVRRAAAPHRRRFWPGCHDHHRASRQNAEFYSDKIARNIERDEEKRLVLEEAGRAVVVVWEHEDVADPAPRRRRRALGGDRRAARPEAAPGVAAAYG
jgi:G:T-mismatch repair DNA endonuclease (very short patch repair protein)